MRLYITRASGVWAIFPIRLPIRRTACAGIAVLSLLLGGLLGPSSASALTGEAAFADGNRLFRDDLYWAALLRYRQAIESGYRTPLLDYNMGVAHYRAQQHIRARAALIEAAQSPSLRVVSQYNLGLNAWAAGNEDEALNWFRQARDQEENEKIREFAIIAISRIQSGRRAAEPITLREEQERARRNLTDLDLRATVGFGTDSNVFRAPDQPYIDFAAANQPVVTPEELSGAFIPVDLRARYSLNSLENESFFGEYRLSGRLYQDQELENGNEITHEARFGSEFELQTDTRKRRVYSAFTIAQHDETYFDPDDGNIREVGGEEIDGRLNYVRYGPEMTFRQSHERLAFGLRIKGQLWNYEETEVVPEYDHEYFVFGGNIQYRFAPTTLLRLIVEKSSRRYGDRPSFDLDANQFLSNPTVRYDYLQARVIARQRITRNMWFGFGYDRTERTDRFVGYNDYTRDGYRFEFEWSPGDRFNLSLRGNYRIYSYPNAFAFNNPVAGTKTLETAYGSLKASYQLTRHLSIDAEGQYRATSSTDTRIQYDRNWYSLGVTWRQ